MSTDCFPLSWSSRPTNLHSFPTRRSSDLIQFVNFRGGDGAEFDFNDGFGASVEGGDEDRKSTRLNSSHVEISYAVFCLKKKKASSATRPSTEQSPSSR